MKLTTLQRAAIASLSVLCAAVIVFGIFNQQSFNRVTSDSSFPGAKLPDYSYYQNDTNAVTESLTASYIIDKLKNADSVFVCTVEKTTNQYECLKHDITIDKVIRGENIQTGDKAVFYEYSNFILDSNGDLSFNQSVTLNVPLKAQKQYLVFAQAMNYKQGYQETLPCREFRIFDAEIDTFFLDGDQTQPLDPTVKTYAEIQDCEYICFSQKGLENLNSIKQTLFDMYL